MKQLTYAMVLVSLTLSAAIFGFFYGWICSTMWGLDAADPRLAIGAMQAMNASVRNAVFAPAFFGTPFALTAAAALLLTQRQLPSAAAFAAAAIVYLCLGLLLTITVNVPMNEALASVEIPDDIESARVIWQDYSERWQVWNQIRTSASGVAFLLATSGLLVMDRRSV